MRKTILFVLLTLTATKSYANELLDNSSAASQIKKAITKFQKLDRKNWAFQVSRYENEEGNISQSVQSYDPLRVSTEQWTLFSIDGKTPTETQQKKFMKSKNKPTGKDKNNFKLSLNELEQVDTLKVESVTPTQFTARFDVYLERLGKKASKSLTGLLTYDRKQNFVKHIEISNIELFSPVLTAEITDFNLLLSFKKLNNYILPHKNNMQMTGTFAFFTEIDEVSTATYSNYQYIGDSAALKE